MNINTIYLSSSLYASIIYKYFVINLKILGYNIYTKSFQFETPLNIPIYWIERILSYERFNISM